MARVFPGSDFEDIYNARNIYTTNIQGDDYKVRRSANDSNLDPRTNTEFQKKIVDAFSLASRIWSNKRQCWKDHFNRGRKIFRYNELEVNSVERELSGYHLAMNILINDLKKQNGSFYDPQCFCITPTDIFGEPLNTYSILDILQHSKIDYAYKEKKLTFDALQPEADRYNRFRSAVYPNPKTFEKCLLSSVGCISRDNCLANSYRDISLVKNIVQWPNIRFEPVDDLIHTPFGIWEHENFTYEKLRTEDLPVTDGSMRGMRITLGFPFAGQSLCSLGNLNITLYTQYQNITGYIQYSPNPPLFDIFYGEDYLGRFGSGGGVLYTQLLDFNLNKEQQTFLGWNEHIYPVVPGYTEWMYPPGKLTEARLIRTDLIGEEKGWCKWSNIEQIWRTPEPIDFTGNAGEVIAKVNIWGYGTCTGEEPPLYCRYPYGAWNLYGSTDLVNWNYVSGANMEFPLNGSQSSYCVGADHYHFPFSGSYQFFKTKIFSSAHTSTLGRVGTLLGDPLCMPYPLNDHCLGPAPGQRGLFFLETRKEFVKRPVACRCPEYSCPPEFPEFGPNDCTLSNIRCCPDNHRLALIGDECVPCVGASPTGLCYDFLI